MIDLAVEGRAIDVDFVVFGAAAPAGNKTALPFKRKDGRLGVAVREGKKDGPAQAWRSRVESVVQGVAPGLPELLDGPLGCAMEFFLPRPSSEPKRRRTWPVRKPDLSKLVRNVEDVLTGTLIADDARIVEYALAKDFVTDGEQPRCRIRLWRVGE